MEQLCDVLMLPGIGQISDPSYYLDLLFTFNTTPGNSNGQR